MKKQKWIPLGCNKKRFLTGIAIAIIMLLSAGCEEEPQKITRVAPVDEIIAIEKTGSIIHTLVWAEWPNGCGRPSHNTVQRHDNTFHITVYGYQNSDEICTQAFIRFSASPAVLNIGPGSYTFRFFCSDSTSIDTTITWDY